MAVDMFIEIGDIKGESKDKTHKEKIDVLAWSWGMSNSGSAHVGGGGGSGKVNVQDLSFTKYIDKSTPALQLACCRKEIAATAALCGRAQCNAENATRAYAMLALYASLQHGSKKDLKDEVCVMIHARRSRRRPTTKRKRCLRIASKASRPSASR